jgi:hypothetical protein
MAKIPLNYFRRVGYSLSAVPVPIYTVPFDRASIILTAIATNITGSLQTVTLSISTANPENGTNLLDIAKAVPLGCNDVANLTVGKVVLTQGDILIASCSSLTAINLNLSILEAVNTR